MASRADGVYVHMYILVSGMEGNFYYNPWWNGPARDVNKADKGSSYTVEGKKAENKLADEQFAATEEEPN